MVLKLRAGKVAPFSGQSSFYCLQVRRQCRDDWGRRGGGSQSLARRCSPSVSTESKVAHLGYEIMHAQSSLFPTSRTRPRCAFVVHIVSLLCGVVSCAQRAWRREIALFAAPHRIQDAQWCTSCRE